jgi:hypothetical protein
MGVKDLLRLYGVLKPERTGNIPVRTTQADNAHSPAGNRTGFNPVAECFRQFRMGIPRSL